MNQRSTPRRLEPLGLNRAFLFLLVVGLAIVAWQRNRLEPVPASAPTAIPAPGAYPTAGAPTNSVTDRGLVSLEQTIHK